MFIQTLLFFTRLPTRKDGVPVENRDKVYWNERILA